MVITHGNGPQVGAELMRSELAAREAYPLPLTAYDALEAAVAGRGGTHVEAVAAGRAERHGPGQGPPTSEPADH